MAASPVSPAPVPTPSFVSEVLAFVSAHKAVAIAFAVGVVVGAVLL